MLSSQGSGLADRGCLLVEAPHGTRGCGCQHSQSWGWGGVIIRRSQDIPPCPQPTPAQPRFATCVLLCITSFVTCNSHTVQLYYALQLRWRVRRTLSRDCSLRAEGGQ